MPPLSKAGLRAEARRILATLSAAERAQASAQICARITALPEWPRAVTIALYSALPTEPDLSDLLKSPGKSFQGVSWLRPYCWAMPRSRLL